MIVGTAYKYSRFLKAYLLSQLEILLGSPYPACYLGEFIALLKAFINGLLILLCIKEELTHSDNAVGSRKSVKHIKECCHLLHCIGFP